MTILNLQLFFLLSAPHQISFPLTDNRLKLFVKLVDKLASKKEHKYCASYSTWRTA